MGGSPTKDVSAPIRKKIVVLGLEAAGKSTLVQKLKYGTADNVKPTIGFSIETFKSNGMDLMVYDISGSARSMWSHYLDGADIILYVVDAS